MPTAGPVQLLYACENVRTVEHGAKLNLPPMTAFRAPGFVEGTWSLECVLDKLAAQLGIDPLELRKLNYADVDTMDGRPYSSKGLMECYRRAEPHWERRHEVRARSDAIWKRGMGMASQTWYGGGGPPSYAWVRLGSDGRANVVTAMQDIGTGTRTAMAQIAAEELGLPLDRVEVQLGDSARGPYATVSGGSSTLPSMGPAVRSAAADAARQVIELAAQRFECEERLLSLKGGRIVSSDGGSWPLEEVTGLLDDGQILGKGARGPNPTGMRVLTFGIQLAEVAVDIGTGEVVVEKIVAIHDVGRVINPLGARSQIEGGIIQALGHTFSEVRLDDPETGTVLTKTLDAYKLPTIADVPEIVCDFVDEPDAHLTNLGSKGLGEPPIVPTAAAIGNAIRDATGADVTSLPITPRGDPAGAPRSRDQEEGACCSWSALARARRRWRHSRSGGRALAGGTELVPLLKEGLVTAERLVDVTGVLPRGISGGTIGAGATLAELEVDPQIPAALREACRLAASPQLREHGHDRRQPAPGDALLVLAPRLSLLPARRRPLPREVGPAPRARVLRQRALRLGAPVRPGRGAARARRDDSDRPARASDRRALPAADRGRPLDDDARAGRADPRARRARGGVERLPEGDGPEALVVRARRRRGRTRRRADADRALRRRAGPVAARVARRGDAPAGHDVQGRDRPRARRPSRRGSVDGVATISVAYAAPLPLPRCVGSGCSPVAAVATSGDAEER